MNYLLKQIADICHDAPDPKATGNLVEFQRRLDRFDEGMCTILTKVHALQGVLDGSPHPHVAGALAGLVIDTCAVCGRDIRNEVHTDKGEGLAS